MNQSVKYATASETGLDGNIVISHICIYNIYVKIFYIMSVLYRLPCVILLA